VVTPKQNNENVGFVNQPDKQDNYDPKNGRKQVDSIIIAHDGATDEISRFQDSKPVPRARNKC
jgi:hypothetical protein